MANGNVKLSVSGVDQFKRGMKDAQTSVKTLDAELKKNEQQFRLTGDAEVYMEQKSEILKRQIEQQKDVVRQAEQALNAMKQNGVNPTSQAFQQMQQQVIRAQGALMGMEADLNNVGSAGQTAAGDVSGLKTSLERMGSQVSFKNLTDGLDKITSKLKSAASAAWNLGKEIVNATLGAGAWADELATEASKYGVSTDRLQRMRNTARLIDTEVETIFAARDRLEKELEGHSASFMGAYAELMPGYNPLGKDFEDVFWDTGEAILAMGDAYKQEAYAQQIFGKSWKELIPLFEAGREEYERTNESWHTVSDENLEKLGKLDDQYQKLTAEWETFQMTVLATMADVLTPLLEKLTEFLGKINEYLQTEEGQEKMAKLGEVLSKLFDDLLNLDPEEALGVFQDLLDKVVQSFVWISDHWQDIVTGIKAIGFAFAGIQLASLAANLLSIGGSLGWFGGGGAAATGAGAAALGGVSGGGKFLPLGTSVLMLYPLAEGIISGKINPAQDISDAWDATMAGAGIFGKHMGDILSGNEALFSQKNADLSRKALGRLGATFRTGSPLDNLFFYPQAPGTNIQYDPNAKPISTAGWSYDPEDFMRYQAQNDRVLELLESGAGQKNSLTSDDISEFRGLPAAIQEAARRGIESANIRVVISDDAMQDISDRTNTGFWDSVMSMVH